MAKLEIIKKLEQEDAPTSVECIEVNVWGRCGHSGQMFHIGSGTNYNASMNYWLEIGYSVQGLPVFYTRTAIMTDEMLIDLTWAERLEKFTQGEADGFSFGDMLPQTSILVSREKHQYDETEDQQQSSCSYLLKISADMGVIFGQSGPGYRTLDIRLDIELEEGIRFMADLIEEFTRASQGLHPDPSKFPHGHSDWPFARDLNRRAYDKISADYQESYFENDLLTSAFDEWLGTMPQAGHVLDAGCGHGNPVITYLLEKGLQVTGSDQSPAMLARARQQFPGVEFWEQAVTQIQSQAVFDGACSFSSVLYLDKIDFLHGIYRLHQALKPGGVLFLYGYDLHPGWRGLPYDVDINQWLWGQTFAMQETAELLSEHGFFKILKTENVTTEQERVASIERWRIKTQENHEKMVKKFPPEYHIPAPDLSKTPTNLAYKYIVIAQKLERA